MKNFVWETHGIHTGTGSDHVKHGIDDLESVVRKAIELEYPCVTFIIHTPRLTGYRYSAEENTDIKFIRGDSAYFNYGKNIKALKRKYINNEILATEQIGIYNFDMSNLVLSRNNEKIKITQREGELLYELIRNRNRVIQRKDLLEKIWGKEDYFLGRSMDVFISKLRKYLVS